MDTDSESIGIDNRASVCISHKIDNFVGEMHDTNRVIIGHNGTRTGNLKTGTLRWKWTDDNGIDHAHTIPNSIYSSTGGVRLLSPQHWAQSIQKNNKYKHPPSCATTGRNVTFKWGDDKYIKTIPLGTKDNVATMYSSPGFDRFQTFCSQAKLSIDDKENILLCEECTSILEDKDDETIHAQPVRLDDHDLKHDKHFQSDLPVDDETVSQIQLQQCLDNQSLDLLNLHTKYGHILFARLREMAKQGVIPSHHVHTKTPACAACLFGRATRRQWRFKTPKNKQHTLAPVTQPSERISVDILYSPSPGFIAQMTGHLTKKRYRYATIYVDHFSGYGYLHLQKTASVEETLQGKMAFEMHAKQYGVQVLSYHADNGVFRANQWVQDAGVNAHHQNGKVERRIRLLQELTRTQLIHLTHQWKAINATSLWPYAMRVANVCLNDSPNMQHKQKLSASQLFSKSTTNDNPRHHHPFGCPTYVLEQPLQSKLPFSKWKQRSKLGLYLGSSPQHARNVSLVLNLQTGLVSPQFHVAHDTSFLTVRNDTTKYPWCMKSGLTERPLFSQHNPDRVAQTPNRRGKRDRQHHTTSTKMSKRAKSNEITEIQQITNQSVESNKITPSTVENDNTKMLRKHQILSPSFTTTQKAH